MKHRTYTSKDEFKPWDWYEDDPTYWDPIAEPYTPSKHDPLSKWTGKDMDTIEFEDGEVEFYESDVKKRVGRDYGCEE